MTSDAADPAPAAGSPQAPIRILFVEDVEYEAELALAHLKRNGITSVSMRVQTETALRNALRDFDPTIILSDFSLPQFDGISALKVAQELAPEIPFIFVSGTIGEERAIEALLRGAVDYVLKGNLARLATAVRRAISDAQARREQQRQRAQIARLDRVLRMLSGVNGLVLRIRDRDELLNETCRLAVNVGGYASAVAYLKTHEAPAQPHGSATTAGTTIDAVRTALAESDEAGTINRVLREGSVLVCNDTSQMEADEPVRTAMTQARLRSIVALPLLVDSTAIGVLTLTSPDVDAVSEEELRMLREVAGNLSFALQYLQQDTRVRFLSHFDPQTGLAKRALFCERLSRWLSLPPGRRARYAIAVIDIERLSLINDSFGRRTGDLLLQHVADRLKRRFPETEKVAHFGGGTFAVIRELGPKSGEELIAAAREHAAALFGDPFMIEGREILIAVRSGFAVYPEHGKDAGTLVQNAEAALRNARAAGERQLHYSAQKHSQLVSNLALETKLRRALERDQYELYYQPKVNVISRQIEGVEALIRWHDPDAGLVPPAQFLAVLETSGLIVDVGTWVIERAAADCRAWLQAGLPPVRVAVNISPLQLRVADFAPTFLRALKGWSTPDAGLDIEITEGVLLEDSAYEVQKLQMLRNCGIRIAIDDFGTGYSSLSRLATLPIDTLKIDRSFIRQVPSQPTGILLVKTIITLARGFGMTTVAEGVESLEQLEFLRHCGCNQSQGFLHSQPLSREGLTSALERGRGALLLPAGPSREVSADSARG